MCVCGKENQMVKPAVRFQRVNFQGYTVIHLTWPWLLVNFPHYICLLFLIKCVFVCVATNQTEASETSTEPYPATGLPTAKLCKFAVAGSIERSIARAKGLNALTLLWKWQRLSLTAQQCILLTHLSHVLFIQQNNTKFVIVFVCCLLWKPF